MVFALQGHVGDLYAGHVGDEIFRSLFEFSVQIKFAVFFQSHSFLLFFHLLSHKLDGSLRHHFHGVGIEIV